MVGVWCVARLGFGGMRLIGGKGCRGDSNALLCGQKRVLHFLGVPI